MYLKDHTLTSCSGVSITGRVMDIEFSDSLPAIYTQHQIEASAPQLIAGKAYYQKVSLVTMIFVITPVSRYLLDIFDFAPR